MRSLLWITVLLTIGAPIAAQQARQATSTDAGTLTPVAVATAQDATADDDAAAADPFVVEPDGHVYFVARFDELPFVEPGARDDGVPSGTRDDVIAADPGPRFSGAQVFTTSRFDDRMTPQRAVIEGAGELVVAPDTWPRRASFGWPAAARLALRLPAPRAVRGRVFVPNADWSGQLAVDFVVPAEAFSPDARADWLRAVADNAAAHLDARHTGAAWYRHRRAAARAALSGAETAARDAVDDADAGDGSRAGRRLDPPSGTMQREFELFSGGRALSENLALDRILPFGDDALAEVPIEEVPGVSVSAYDWSALIAGLEPETDPLAASIPADQHGLFFPTFEALVAVTDELDGLGAPLGRQFELRSETAETRARYERQLGLPMSELSRLLGPHLIRSVAITGGDAYLRTGSDVAMLFEPRETLSALAAITARLELALGNQPGVERSSGELHGVSWSGLRNADRSICSYLASLDGAIVVTNSLAQLEALVGAARGETPSLDETPEYTWFRDRYRLGDPEESALLVLSDDTIRRWCGPRLRIGSSRRARAAAVLGELGARLLDHRPAPADGEQPLAAPDDLPDAGALFHDGLRVRSEAYGTPAFATPIAELDLDLVTDEEEAFYTRWRQGYESGWRQVFDPIAVRLGVGDGRLAVDVSVRPLIADSDYERYLRIARGGAIQPGGNDPHAGTLLHVAVAIGPDELDLLPETGVLKVMAPGVDVFGWIGGSFSYYLDDTSYWTDMRSADVPEAYLEDNLTRLPVALQAQVGNGLKLAVFLTTVRGLVESSAPGQTLWENREYAGHSYVRVSEAENQSGMDLALYYTTGPQHLTLSLSEELIQRVIDRRVARATAREAGLEPPATGVAPWNGEHLAARLDVPAVIEHVEGLTDGLLRDMRQASWANLPILNDWRRRFPDRDPLDVHEAAFARRPVCPGGGEYRWNAAWQTMESTSYGHPGAPLDGPMLPGVLSRLREARVGTSFEDDGLRGRVELLLTGDDDG